VVLAAFKAAVRALRGFRRWVRLPHASAKVFFPLRDYCTGLVAPRDAKIRSSVIAVSNITMGSMGKR
jgi:hypothetical protein